MVPEPLRSDLARFVPPTIRWNDIEIVIGLPRGLSAHLPAAMVKRNVAYVTEARGAMETIGATMDHTVFLNPDYADFDTASGRALLVHELWHVHQNETVPNFEAIYAAEARKTPSDRPWENIFERDAYEVEKDAYCAMVNEGWPPGRWTPLGVQLWGCN